MLRNLSKVMAQTFHRQFPESAFSRRTSLNTGEQQHQRYPLHEMHVVHPKPVLDCCYSAHVCWGTDPPQSCRPRDRSGRLNIPVNKYSFVQTNSAPRHVCNAYGPYIMQPREHRTSSRNSIKRGATKHQKWSRYPRSNARRQEWQRHNPKLPNPMFCVQHISRRPTPFHRLCPHAKQTFNQ